MLRQRERLLLVKGALNKTKHKKRKAKWRRELPPKGVNSKTDIIS